MNVTGRAPVALAVLGAPGLLTAHPWLWLAGAVVLVALLVAVDVAIAAPVADSDSNDMGIGRPGSVAPPP